MLAGGLYFGPGQREEIAHRELVEDIIDFLEIQHIRKKVVGTLAYGLQKRVELARALALEPKLLLLDEPMAGMNAEEKEDMARFILDINEERGHHHRHDRARHGRGDGPLQPVTVLDFGEQIADGHARGGPARTARCSDAYLGEQHDAGASRA